MPRFLLALFLLVALSACGSDRDDASPTDPTVPETEDVSNDARPAWQLPWHQAAAAVCLSSDLKVNGRNLVDALLDPSVSDTQLLQVLAPDQSESTSNGLFAFIQSEWGEELKEGYSWGNWPAGLALRIRDVRQDTLDASLDLNTLVLPWPFPGDDNGALVARLEAAQETADLDTIPARTAADFNPTSGLYLNAFMRAADDAVTTNPPNLTGARPAFETEAKGQGCAVERAWIVARARSTHGHSGREYPPSVTVCTDDTLLTTRTQWERRGPNADTLHLRLGWDQPFVERYDNWPCGMFKDH